MHDSNEPHPTGEAEDHLLGTAAGEVAVYSGLAMTVGTLIGIYTGFWLILAVAVLVTALWAVSGAVIHLGRQSAPEARTPAPTPQPARRAA